MSIGNIGNVIEPNITKLTTNSVSHNVGKKPNTRYSKRKKKLPVITRVKPTYSSPTCPSDSVTPTSSTCSSVENTSTSYVPTPNPDPSPYPLYYPTPYSMQFPFTPGMYGWQGFNSFECDKVPQMPLSSSQYAFSNPSSSATAMPFTTPLSSATPKCIFWVCKLNNRITTCFGCRGKFTRAANKGIPVPPLDLILRCNESRPYYGKDGIMHEKENSNTYYHPNTSCIKQKHPEFKPNLKILRLRMLCVYHFFQFISVCLILSLT